MEPNEIEYPSEEARRRAFCRYLVEVGIDPDDAKQDPDDDQRFYLDDKYSREYYCVTEEEAREVAIQGIKYSLWAFRYSYLCHWIPALCNINEKHWQGFVGNVCEDANDFIEALIGDKFNDFVDDAIRCDGVAHFMNSYDGQITDEIQGYLIVRTN